MDDQSFSGYQCWKPNRIPIVINVDAIAIDEPNFLATHVPFDQIRYEKSLRHETSASETKLLGELVRCANEGLHTFTVIQGSPGTGKSHLIRWLRGRYQAELARKDEEDVVLLIERSNNSLRQTLLQILESGVFIGEAFSVQKQKLEGAARTLSQQGLEELFLSSLHVAHVESSLPDDDLPRGISDRLSYFLLDPKVREVLRQEDGPIKRIIQFLTGGDARPQANLAPRFEPSDFDFSIEAKRELRVAETQGGYKETRDLLRNLELPGNREQLARYLNKRLEFAISQTTSLSSDDLKQMFNDLRKELRKQNRSLAIFIEDVTAFVGLDRAIIDILVTQHTGVGNQEHCRLNSVIGVTDDYYRDSLPDNIRQRITHHLVLNVDDGFNESSLLANPDKLGDLAARYLNAIRVDQNALRSWYETGSHEADLPVACVACPHREPCHQSFGFINIVSGDGYHTHEIGLYPFNEQALAVMYQQLDTKRVPRTPRSFLRDVLYFVLSNHGHLISNRQFPPQKFKLGDEFGAPTLANPQQSRLLEKLSSRDQDRVETLVVFWGDRTLDAADMKGQPAIGQVVEGIFKAFDVPFLNAIVGNASLPPAPSKKVQPLPTPATTISTTKLEPPQSSEQDPVVEDIENWRAGKKLQNYEQLSRLVVSFLKESIDWTVHGISPALIEERMKPGRFAFEDQVGRNQTHHLLLKRSKDLAYALQALHALRGDKSLEANQTAGHLLNLSVWMRQIEQDVAAFVRAPSAVIDPSNLLFVQTQGAAALATLAGELRNEGEVLDPVFFSLVASARNNENWAQVADLQQEVRSKEWGNLIQRHGLRRSASMLREHFLQTFNCPQGQSKDIRFIDGALLLDALIKLQKEGWMPEGLPNDEEGNVWDSAVKIYSELEPHFESVLQTEHSRLENLLAQLDELTGGDSASSIGSAIDDFLLELQQAQVYYPEEQLGLPDLSSCDNSQDALREALSIDDPLYSAAALSAVFPHIRILFHYVAYLGNLRQWMVKKQTEWKQGEEHISESGISEKRDEIDKLYQRIDKKITHLVDVKDQV